MTKWIDAKLKKQAYKDYVNCCGHFPAFIYDKPYLSDYEWIKYAKEYGMSLEEFKKYADYFYDYAFNQSMKGDK